MVWQEQCGVGRRRCLPRRMAGGGLLPRGVTYLLSGETELRSRHSRGPVTPDLVGALIACRGDTPVPHPTTANGQPTIANRHQPPTDNHQPPPTAINRQPIPTNHRQLPNHQPPSTTNRQPEAKWAEKRSKMEISRVVPDPWRGSNGPFWAILGLF